MARKSTIEGIKTRKGAFDSCGSPSAIMFPQLGVGGRTPRPRKLSDASARIRPAITSPARVITDAVTLGRISRHSTLIDLAPSPRDAITYSEVATFSVFARARRAKYTQLNTVSPMMRVRTLG